MALAFVDLKQQYARLKPVIDQNIQRVLDHGAYIMGPEVGALEERLAAFVGARHAIGASSGTDALLIALMAKDVGRGDAVFVPSFTYTATAEVILCLGATPVFVDVDPVTYNINVADLERRIAAVQEKGELQPRAIIAVDLFGLPADYRDLNRIAEKHRLFLLADAAQSTGGSLDNQQVGSLAPVTATSFFPAKPLGCYGDGGAIFTNDADLADVMRSIRLHGQGKEKYEVVRVGVNGRLDTLQAAILLAKLDVFPEELESRDQLADYYTRRLREAVQTPVIRDGSSSAWAQYTIQVDNRDDVQQALKEQGIPSAVYYPKPMHLQQAYHRFGDGEGSMPVSERLCKRVLSLPMHPYLSEADAARICDAVIAAAAR